MKPILCFTLNGFVDGYADPYVPQFNVTCGVMVGGIFGFVVCAYMCDMLGRSMCLTLLHICCRYPLFNHYGAYYDPSADPTPCQW